MALLIVGLGNPGQEYQSTRHNLGARVVQQWASASVPTAPIHILLPEKFFMNDSGQTVAQWLKNKTLTSKDILIVHDDVEMPLGQWQLKSGGSARGHNGVRSIHHVLGTTDVPRLRIGVGKPATGALKDFVLGKFTPDEEQQIAAIMPALLQALTDYSLASDPKIINTSASLSASPAGKPESD